LGVVAWLLIPPTLLAFYVFALAVDRFVTIERRTAQFCFQLLQPTSMKMDDVTALIK